MPVNFDDDLFGVEARFHPDGERRRIQVYSVVYAPIGFFPFAGTGNGDYYGLYWPIGHEELPPIVAFTSHDAYAVIPEYGDLSGLVRCQLATSDDDTLSSSELDGALQGAGICISDFKIPKRVAASDHLALLAIDPRSAFRHCAAADLAIAAGNFDSAESHYRTAIELLPEYVAAHYGLGYLFRRTQRQADASLHLKKSLTCPMAFYGGSIWSEHQLPGEFRNDWARKALLWLQQTKVPHESLVDDPFFRNIGKLNLKSGDAQNEDWDILTGVVNEYLKRGNALDAVLLWLVLGDRAAMETTSFRERRQLTSKSFGIRLAEMLRLAGLERRASLVDNMLSLMKNPDGLQL
ncbi:MAG: tetratricopeptide repeat protein [Planctomycetes bacterium]|nr:tetratricopeptide repeat protein [Planctomycetota bacterium]